MSFDQIKLFQYFLSDFLNINIKVRIQLISLYSQTNLKVFEKIEIFIFTKGLFRYISSMFILFNFLIKSSIDLSDENIEYNSFGNYI